MSGERNVAIVKLHSESDIIKYYESYGTLGSTKAAVGVPGVQEAACGYKWEAVQVDMHVKRLYDQKQFYVMIIVGYIELLNLPFIYLVSMVQMIVQCYRSSTLRHDQHARKFPAPD